MNLRVVITVSSQEIEHGEESGPRMKGQVPFSPKHRVQPIGLVDHHLVEIGNGDDVHGDGLQFFRSCTQVKLREGCTGFEDRQGRQLAGDGGGSIRS
jgi:hypothetical protein